MVHTRCACGAIRYEIAAEPVMAGHCQCRDCQPATVHDGASKSHQSYQGDSAPEWSTASQGDAEAPAHMAARCASGGWDHFGINRDRYRHSDASLRPGTDARLPAMSTRTARADNKRALEANYVSLQLKICRDNWGATVPVVWTASGEE